MSKSRKGRGDTRLATGRRSSTVQAVQHAIEVLRAISQAQPEIGISELARRVGLHKSSVSRLVATLVAEHLVERNDQTERVRLGFGLVALAAPLVSGADLAKAAQPQLIALADGSGETANLSVWDGHQAISVHQAVGTNSITHYAAPGRAIPAHCTASGKLLLAFASAQEIDKVLSGKLQRFTEHTTTSPALLREELLRIRAQGYAVNYGEFASDVGAVAAPIRNMDGQVLAVVTITVPTYRFSPERQFQLLAMATATGSIISAQLGYREQSALSNRVEAQGRERVTDRRESLRRPEVRKSGT